MTYQDIVNWCERNVPMGQAETFSEWLDMCEQEFLNAGHFLPEEVEPLLEKRWNRNHPTHTEEIPSRFERFEQERDREQETKGAILERRISKFPQDLEFTPSQISKFTGVNKNTTRRELQELVAEGKLQRVSRGRYRQAP
jgi:hypothetical protein